MSHLKLSNTVTVHILTVLFSVWSYNIMATNYYVKTTGSANKTGLTWTDATTINAALSKAITGDVIHIAAGTYIPAVLISGGSLTEDKTFEIKVNITLIGGYPANPADGSVASDVNKTILSGNLGATNSFHVISVTATAESGQKVVLTNLSITAGKAGVSNAGSVSINTINFPRFSGAAMIISKSSVELNNTQIHHNQSDYSTPGVYVFSLANVAINNCTIENNTGSGNGGGIWNDGSTITIYNSTISSNQVSGVGAGIYSFNASVPSITNIYNSTISNNKASHKAGYYGREKSVGVMVNCTFYGNSTTSLSNGGGGISLYTNNKSTNAAKLDIFSSTITGNSGALTDGGGIRLNDQYCKLRIINSIVSGNNNGDIVLYNSAAYSKKSSVVSNKVYNDSSLEILGQTFDYSTMLTPLADNGGNTKTCKLTGFNNPALTNGMSDSELTTLGSTYSHAIGITPTCEKLVNGTDLFEYITSDTTYSIVDGLTATEIKYISTSDLPMKISVFEADLTNPGLSIEVSTPNNSNVFARQRMTEQAVYKDFPTHKVYGGVNGDFFNTTTGVPQGILYKNGVAIKTTFQDDICTYFAITKNKKAIVASQDSYISNQSSIKEAIGGRVWLVKNGLPVSQTDTKLEPRTCIGVSTDSSRVYILAVDGRNTSYSNGMTYSDLSKCMKALGAFNSINLDGGGSTTFFVRSTPDFKNPRFEIRNVPTDTTGEREVSNGLLFISNM